MALIFPRDMTTYRCWRVFRVTPMWRQELSRIASGETQGKSYGSPIWQVEAETHPMPRWQAEGIYADFMTLQGVTQTFLCHPAKGARPAKVGSTPASSFDALTVNAIRSDNAAIRISGLPNGLVLSAGDAFSVKPAALPGGSREHYRLARSVTVPSSGLSPWVDVVPHIRPSVATGDPVEMWNPMIEVRLMPDSLTITDETRTKSRIGFRAVQVVR